MKYLLSPSVLSADLSNIREVSAMLREGGADWVHLDVMDGVFVPNISFGLPIVRAFRKHIDRPLDVHLMIVEPEKYIEAFRQAGANAITVHYEACVHLHRTVHQIKNTGAHAGVAINPHTPVTLLEDVLGELDLVLVMSVNPGFGGQRFIPHSIEKIRKLKQMRDAHSLRFTISVDGGIDEHNARDVLAAGADVLVVGSGIFHQEDPVQTMRVLKDLHVDGAWL